MPNSYKDATMSEVDEALQQSGQAFKSYRQLSLKERVRFLRTIAAQLEKAENDLIDSAHEETNLDKDRLGVELKRTLFQLNSYAAACEAGNWLDIRIDTADPQRQPLKPDLRKMMVPLGPVVVFGASNFPFAYSTAGGDTACALAAGCTVVLKAHPAHANTSQKVADAIKSAAQECGLPEGIFMHLHGASFTVGEALVKHPLTKAVGFTGSLQGGKALFQLANHRPVPIPVFAEMGSVNPVFLLPQKIKEDGAQVAHMYAASITQSAGQFCTNPGILVGIQNDELEAFKKALGGKIKQVLPAAMLHDGIAKGFHEKRKKALAEKGVELIAVSDYEHKEAESLPTLAQTSAEHFLQNPLLHHEVFGPYSLLVVCLDTAQMQQVAEVLEGQLTTTLMATTEEVKANKELVYALQNLCGRFVLNGVPTGVEVTLAMQHGGPYPATTDSRFTAVGADGIKRFARPVCYQNWNNELLPDELKNENPLGLWRTVNNILTQAPIA